MANEYIRKEWAGGALRTTLNGTLTAVATTINVVDASSFPAGTFPFVLVLDRGLSTEEKVLCSTRGATSFTVLQRGYDGSVAAAHASSGYVEHVLDAYTVDQANAIATTMNTQGDLAYKSVTGDNTSFARLGIGTANRVLLSTGSAPSWGLVQTGSFATGAVDNTALGANAVTDAKVATGAAIALNKMANGTTGQLVVAGATGAMSYVTQTGDVKFDSSGVAAIQPLVIVDGDVSDTAGIQPKKLLNGTAAQVLVTNGTSVPTWTSLSGDVTIGATGVTAIGAQKVTEAMMSVAAGEPAGAWVAYTPTYTLFALGNGTTVARYWRVGKTVNVKVKITLGSTSSVTGAMTVSLPGAALASDSLEFIGTCFDVSGTAKWMGLTDKATTSTVNINYLTSLMVTTNVSATAPFTWTTGDIITFAGTYELA